MNSFEALKQIDDHIQEYIATSNIHRNETNNTDIFSGVDKHLKEISDILERSGK